VILDVSGNIFASKAECLVNPVNCVGVAGAGLAKAFMEKFPNNYKAYRARCADGRLRIGAGYVFRSSLASTKVANFPTKSHWRDRSELRDIDSGLDWLLDEIDDGSLADVKSLAIPALGCGLGGLDWRVTDGGARAHFETPAIENPPRPRDGDPACRSYRIGRDIAIDQAEAWLNDRYPMWRDAFAYWD
jgi:O-acetyl-ADP-ribose deacetylase (regulator of RNase III)